jgi:hypothetical protein
MSVKTAGVGHFQIPTAPAALTAVAQSGSANTLGSAVSFGHAPSALYITGVALGAATTQVPTYVQFRSWSAAASLARTGALRCQLRGGGLCGYRIPTDLPADSGGERRSHHGEVGFDSVASAVNWGVSLECIAQSNVVDDGITVGTVNLVNTLTTYTGNTVQTGDSFARLGAPAGASHSADVAAVKVDTAAIKTKTDNLPAAPASTTNITAGTITTVTNLTNAPTAGDFTAAMKTSLNAATPASVTGAVGSVTGAVGSVTGNVGGNVTGSVGSVVGLTPANLDVAVSTRLASASYTAPLTAATTRSAVGLASANLDTQLAALDADILTRLPTSSYTAPDNATITSTKTVVDGVKAKTDSLTFTIPGKLDSHVMYVNSVLVIGTGAPGDRWRAFGT